MTAPSYLRLPLRLSLISSLFVAVACGPALPEDVEVENGARREVISSGTPQRLRLMAANTSSGNYQSYDLGHGTRIFQGVKPDVVMIQEFNYKKNATADVRAFVDTAFGTTYSYFQETGAQIPNGIISRYPILESGEWKDSSVSNRDFAWARIDIPGPVDLWAVSVHFLTSSATNRNNEATQLVGYIRGKVPAGDYLAIGGDFNTSTRSEPAVATLAKLVVATAPYPADKAGNGNTNASRARPYDWVLVNAALEAYKTEAVMGTNHFPNGWVVDTRVYSPISELSPALKEDSGAPQMQHMAIVRDFMIPSDSAVAW
jgi:endonuclease/exonuclease/phosphatase family metal-dependent hydrolase